MILPNINQSNLLTPEAETYRLRLQTKLLEYLDLSGVRAVLGKKAHELEMASNIFDSPTHLASCYVCDTLCAVMEMPIGTVAILHSRKQETGPEGVGRTSILLHWLGIRFESLAEEKHLRKGHLVVPSTNSHLSKLICCDWAYLFSNNGRLAAAPCLAEPLLGLWDVARCIYRMVDPHYFPGKRLTPEGRKTLDELVRSLPAASYLAHYSSNDQPRKIDFAVILEISEQPEIRIRIIEPKDLEAPAMLKAAFDSVIHLKTTFWHRVRYKHEQLVTNLITDLAVLPRIVHVSLPAKEMISTVRATTQVKQIYFELDEAFRRLA